MDIGTLFVDELLPETQEVEGVWVKAVPPGAGQVDAAMPISLWPAAVSLGKHLKGRDMRDKRTIELGAGTGFLSLFLLKHSVISAPVITDAASSVLHTQSLSLIHENLALNPALPASVQSLDWAACPSLLYTCFDVVLGSDVM